MYEAVSESETHADPPEGIVEFLDGVVGRLYVADTINRLDDSRAFEQSGTAPQFDGGLWSLTTCKHRMRRADTFKKHFEPTDESDNTEQEPYPPKRAMFVFVVSSKAEFDRQYLVSVALVTRAFELMTDYYEFLRSNHVSDGAVDERVVGLDADGNARKPLGDCIVDDDGKAILPPLGHSHRSDSEKCAPDGESSTHSGSDSTGDSTDVKRILDHEDHSPDTLKCVSDPGSWISFPDPERSPMVTDEVINQGYRTIDKFGEIAELLDTH
jgi:hypothetical protein